MSQKIRAKFRLNKIERSIGTKSVVGEQGVTSYEPCEMQTISMSPVYGNGDPNHENTRFWQASPGGSFVLNCVNADAVAHLELGKEYYFDITPADEPAT